MINPDGSGRKMTCDSRCYNAIGSTCNCCCGGVNHGVGFQSASKFWNDVSKQDPKALNALAEGLEKSKAVRKEDVHKIINFLTKSVVKGNL